MALSQALMVRVAERLRVLGQPVRLRLVEHLVQGESTPQDLSEALGLSQQNLSKHLLVLHRAGVVSRRPEGASVWYALRDEGAVVVFERTIERVRGHLRDLSGRRHGRPAGAWPSNHAGCGNTSPCW